MACDSSSLKGRRVGHSCCQENRPLLQGGTRALLSWWVLAPLGAVQAMRMSCWTTLSDIWHVYYSRVTSRVCTACSAVHRAILQSYALHVT
jgi:hypothetical protein